MNSSSVTQPVNAARERQVIGGSLDRATGIYSITLDGGETVTTTDQDIANAAASARSKNLPIVVDLEARAGGQPPVVLELRTAPKPVTSRPGSDATSAARVAAPAADVSTAIAARPALPTGLISKPDELSEQLTRLQAHYHVLSPAIAVADMAPGYGANLAVVKIDPAVVLAADGNGVGPDCYYSKTTHKEPNKRSLNKQGVLKIGQASGVQWDPRLCRRTDNARVRNYWAWEYVGYVRTHDGQILTIKGSRELDLRDGSAEAAGMKDGQLIKARAVGNELCETKAMLRALRTLGIRPAYTVEELQKPFLIVRFSFTPDMKDPEIKKLVTERAIGGIGALYPEMSSPPELSTTSAPALPAKTDPFEEAEAAAAAPAGDGRPIGACKVVEVKSFTGTGKPKNGQPGRPYTKTTVTFDTGEEGVTFSATIAETAQRAKASGAWVKPRLEENADYPDQQDLKALEILDGSQPDLPMAGTEGKY